MHVVVFRFGMFFVIFVIMRAIALVFIWISFWGYNQNYFQDHFGGSVGLQVNFGTHANSIGVNLKGFYADYFYQFNASSTVNLYLTNLGGKDKYVEFRNAAGAVFLGGKRQGHIDFMLDGLNHQTPYNLGAGFNYVLYNDTRGTSQRSGGFAIHIKKISLYLENDVFGGQAKDRFRTGHVFMSYRDSVFRIGSGVNLWTGETANSHWQHISFDECPSGFRVLEDLPYGRTSHGIAYASFTVNPIGYQYATAKIGLDSEHIRHFFQNRLMHDLIFLPETIERSTPHYPRLDEHGCPVFESDQVRKNKFYFQLGTNDNWSY